MVPIIKQVIIYLWYVATNNALKDIADKFDQTISTIAKCIRRVANAILGELTSELITWPQNRRLTEVQAGFEKMKGMKNVNGAIDGSHIPITGREYCKENYINRKGFESVVLQGTCDHERRFTDCYTGWPGSVHDARVFANSDLFLSLDEDYLSKFPGESFLVGDAAYGLTRFMMTPFKQNGYLTQKQQKYNYVQSCTRNVIERAFALLKGRFPRLKKLDVKNMEDATKVIIATCTLHNFCIDEGLDEDDFDQPIEEEVNDFINVAGSSTKDAELKRIKIMNELK